MAVLHTLGRLYLAAPATPDQPLFTGPKPLMMLTYLAIEGPTTRRHLGELFYATHSDRLDNVSATIRRLRNVREGIITNSGGEVFTAVSCDYLDVLNTAPRDPLAAHGRYHGSFLKGCDLSVFGTEFETWAYQHRSSLAETLRNSYLVFNHDGGAFIVSIHPEDNGIITAPIVLSAFVDTGKNTFGDTVRTATYLDAHTTPYVQQRAIHGPAYLTVRHDRVVFGEVMEQYLSALRAAGFSPTTAPGVNGNFVLVYPNGQTDSTSITLYRSAGGVTARFMNPR